MSHSVMHSAYAVVSQPQNQDLFLADITGIAGMSRATCRRLNVDRENFGNLFGQFSPVSYRIEAMSRLLSVAAGDDGFQYVDSQVQGPSVRTRR
ncbi:hypothetical protein J7T55_003880 [Diaporthe amygdali]|uniref:uncharacterized protein n=1 Tax=Phomopsis amygdali TaxID=1214568 RepID=UPI0022FF350B|nr:uncharacterized protein J7T55_003880 [Diaporthe amygdali]KAJ0117464.1 hypothetical protein J7T55_003880 [Diaporthe amygdali]